LAIYWLWPNSCKQSNPSAIKGMVGARIKALRRKRGKAWHSSEEIQELPAISQMDLWIEWQPKAGFDGFP